MHGVFGNLRMNDPSSMQRNSMRQDTRRRQGKTMNMMQTVPSDRF